MKKRHLYIHDHDGHPYWFVFYYNSSGALIGYRSMIWNNAFQFWYPLTEWYNKHVN